MDFKLSVQFESAEVREAISRETSCCFRSCFSKIEENFSRSLEQFQMPRQRLGSTGKDPQMCQSAVNRTCAACGWVSERLFSSVGVWQSSHMISNSSPCLDEYYAGFNLELFWHGFIFLTKTIPNCPVVGRRQKQKRIKKLQCQTASRNAAGHQRCRFLILLKPPRMAQLGRFLMPHFRAKAAWTTHLHRSTQSWAGKLATGG